ncbi:GroES-like protein [Ascodesmis nigricans]|uniref:GroES-like protein n=1 Tax=Ascodesmis nigricans TaxID=341454 RepID=A0A4S2MTC6_9PEZI|nr:GroES-like protein [Ascodesmis nigricans]
MTDSRSPPTTTTAIVLHGPKDLRIETLPLPPPPPGHLQIEIRSTTLCGSDLHYYNHFRNGNIVCTEPLALGHESSGTVVAIGEGVEEEFKIGDMVALEVGIPCGECGFCDPGAVSSPAEQSRAPSTAGQEAGEGGAEGKRPKQLGPRYNLCPSLRFRSSAKSTPHLWGTLQTHLNHPSPLCHLIPSSSTITFADAALLEPLAVAVHAHRRSGLSTQGKRVLIMGSGAIGLLVAVVSRAYGASHIITADVSSSRVAFGVDDLRWATAGYTVLPSSPPTTTAENVKSLLGDQRSRAGVDGFDIVFECTGFPDAVAASIYAAAPGAVVVLIGMGHPEMVLPVSAAALREVDVKGSFRYGKGDYAEARRLLVEGGVEGVGRLVGVRVNGVERVEEGFRVAAEGGGGGRGVKVECVFGEE